jgi:hypothetical protein
LSESIQDHSETAQIELQRGSTVEVGWLPDLPPSASIFVKIGEALTELMNQPLVQGDEICREIAARIARSEGVEELCDRISDLELRIEQLKESAAGASAASARVPVYTNAAGGLPRRRKNRLCL